MGILAAILALLPILALLYVKLLCEPVMNWVLKLKICNQVTTYFMLQPIKNWMDKANHAVNRGNQNIARDHLIEAGEIYIKLISLGLPVPELQIESRNESYLEALERSVDFLTQISNMIRDGAFTIHRFDKSKEDLRMFINSEIKDYMLHRLSEVNEKKKNK